MPNETRTERALAAAISEHIRPMLPLDHADVATAAQQSWDDIQGAVLGGRIAVDVQVDPADGGRLVVQVTERGRIVTGRC